MLPEYPKLKNLEFTDLDLIAKKLAATTHSICELNLANLIIWKNFDRPQITCINKNLCVQVNPLNEAPYFLEPLGNHKLLETTKICLSHTRKLSRLSEKFIQTLSTNEYRLIELRNQFDYVYLVKSLAELKGKKFDGKRNHIKRFLRTYPKYEYLNLKPEHKKAAQQLFEKWFGSKSKSRFFTKLAYHSQKEAIKTTFLLFDKIPFSGGALMVNGTMVGFILGSPINKETISIHFAYRDPAVPGCLPLLFKEAHQKTFVKYKFVNLEQDLGIPGLRKSKLSWQPRKLEKKFEIRA